MDTGPWIRHGTAALTQDPDSGFGCRTQLKHRTPAPESDVGQCLRYRTPAPSSDVGPQVHHGSPDPGLDAGPQLTHGTPSLGSDTGPCLGHRTPSPSPVPNQTTEPSASSNTSQDLHRGHERVARAELKFAFTRTRIPIKVSWVPAEPEEPSPPGEAAPWLEPAAAAEFFG